MCTGTLSVQKIWYNLYVPTRKTHFFTVQSMLVVMCFGSGIWIGHYEFMYCKGINYRHKQRRSREPQQGLLSCFNANAHYV